MFSQVFCQVPIQLNTIESSAGRCQWFGKRTLTWTNFNDVVTWIGIERINDTIDNVLIT
jgi:hypothetical protein